MGGRIARLARNTRQADYNWDIGKREVNIDLVPAGQQMADKGLGAVGASSLMLNR